jgi:hypothetical protein
MFRSIRKTFLLTACLLVLAGAGIAHGEVVPRKPGPKPERYAPDYRTMESPSWKRDFPNLGRYEVLAAATPKTKKSPYNCIAHTLRIYNEWVWPGPKVSDFDRLYSSHGYRRVRGLDYHFDSKLDKIVLYAKKGKNGGTECTHGCRQLADGTWTSKLGQGPLIRHSTPGAVSGPSYGRPIAVYVRTRGTPPVVPSSSSRRTTVARSAAPRSPEETHSRDENPHTRRPIGLTHRPDARQP